MILSILVILLIGVIAYFHFVQGLFSATLSAIIVVLAAVLAVSYNETVVNLVLRGRMADEANAGMMCVIFATVYIVLRVIFDKAVPGNVRVPVIVDKVGAGIMGVIAGIFAAGVFALAAQMLPFAGSIGGYSRYAIRSGSHQVTIPTRQQYLDSYVYDELKSDSPTFDPADQQSLLIPVDDILVGTVAHLSDGGSLAGPRSLQSIHPDYLQELFGQRIGIQVGGKRSAMNLAKQEEIRLGGVYIVPQLESADPEFKTIRGTRKVEAITKPAADQVLLVVRMTVSLDASDEDRIFRFSTGSIRLVANDKDYYPIGTVDGGNVLLVQKPDDFLFVDTSKSDGAIDAAFLVNKTDLFGQSEAADKIPPGRFVEVKRFARVDLSDQEVQTAIPADNSIMRKPIAMAALKLPAALPTQTASQTPQTPSQINVTPAPTPTPSQPQTSAPPPPPAPTVDSSLLDSNSGKVSPTLPQPVGVNGIDQETQNVPVAGGTISLRDGKLAVVKIDPTETLEKLAAADNPLTDLAAPEGKKVVQVSANKSADWAGSVSQLKLVDANNNSYPPSGVYAIIDNGGKTGMFMRYDMQHTLGSITAPTGTANSVVFIFLVPSNTQLKQPVDLKVQ